MPSLKEKFKFLERGFKDVLVLLPGWAADYRIFSNLKLNYNYLLPLEFSPFNFVRDLSEVTNELFPKQKISLFGYSLGSFLAVDFAKGYPERVNELMLLSVRKEYQPQALKEIGEQLEKNKRAWLYRFYLNCFSKGDLEGRNWFKKNLLKDYLDEMALENLMIGLDYLSSAKIKPEYLSRIKKLKFFHGSSDTIAPLKEVEEIKSGLPQAEFICLSGLGHLLFLNRQFKDEF